MRYDTPVCMSACDFSLLSERDAVTSPWGEGKGFRLDFGTFYMDAMCWGNTRYRRKPELPINAPSCEAHVPPAVAFRLNNPLLFGVAFSASVDVNVLNVPVPSFHAKPLRPCHRRPPQR